MSERWGILGGGNISFSHATALVRSTHAELVGIADIEVAARERVEAEFSVPTFATAEELLDRARPDAVTIALPHGLHLAGARSAADRGIHVLCEKPLAPTVTECDEMIRLCAERGVRLGAILNNRGYAQTRWVRDRIASGAFHARAFTATLALTMPSWRGQEAATGAAMLLGAGIHYLDLFAWWFGQLVEIGVVSSTNSVTSVALRFAGGVSGVFRVSSSGGGRPARVEIDGDEGHLAFVGSVIAEIDDALGIPPPAPEVVPGLPFGSGHLVVIDEAAAALARGAPFPVDGRAGRDAVAMVERIDRAVRSTPRLAAS